MISLKAFLIPWHLVGCCLCVWDLIVLYMLGLYMYKINGSSRSSQHFRKVDVGSWGCSSVLTSAFRSLPRRTTVTNGVTGGLADISAFVRTTFSQISTTVRRRSGCFSTIPESSILLVVVVVVENGIFELVDPLVLFVILEAFETLTGEFIGTRVPEELGEIRTFTLLRGSGVGIFEIGRLASGELFADFFETSHARCCSSASTSSFFSTLSSLNLLERATCSGGLLRGGTFGLW